MSKAAERLRAEAKQIFLDYAIEQQEGGSPSDKQWQFANLLNAVADVMDKCSLKTFMSHCRVCGGSDGTHNVACEYRKAEQIAENDDE